MEPVVAKNSSPVHEAGGIAVNETSGSKKTALPVGDARGGSSSEKLRYPNFISPIRGMKVMARMNDGRPINATLEAFNAYELLFDLGHGKKMICFKHAIASIEYVDAANTKVKPRGKATKQRW